MMSQTQFQEKIQTYLKNHFDQYLDLLRQMVEINSFTANGQGVNEVGELTVTLFNQRGFKVEFVP